MKILQLLIIILSIPAIVGAQFTEEYHFMIESAAMNETREVWVSLPKYYHQNNYRCHTLYLFDGDVRQTSETIRAIRNELFESGGYIQPLIIVGIEQKRRSHELNPYGKTGDTFLKFIESELIPKVDSTFHTNENRIVAGHSMGGYFALSAWMKSDKFKSCFAFSPAIYNDENKITRELSEYLKNQRPKGVVYVNHGTDGTTETAIMKYIDDLKETFEQDQNEDLFFQYKVYEGYGHNFTPIVGMTDALLYHFSIWNFSEALMTKLWEKEVDPIQTFEKKYEDLDQWAGFEVTRENDLINNLAYHYFNTGDTLKALELVEYAINLEPNDGFAYMNKGEILMDLDKHGARKALLKALTLLKPEDVFESSKNFREFEFWKSVLEENLKKLEEE